MDNNKITIKADRARIERATGITFDDMESLADYVLDKIAELSRDNKNYNKRQYNIINDLFFIITSIAIEN